MKFLRRALFMAPGALFALFGPLPRAAAVGDAATHYTVYVPANNEVTDRRAFVIVTSVSDEPNTVSIVDDAADGDSDDTVSGVVLNKGESYLVRIADGATNDDKGGKQDGDYFVIDGTHPLIVQTATASNWQHDWVPSVNRSGIGTSFIVYAPPTSGYDNDVDVFAYQDDTHVRVSDITATARTTTGKTSVNLGSATRVLTATLDQGEDLIVRENGLGLDVFNDGHTYWVQSDRPITVQSGHLGQAGGGSQARDGAGFVPSVNGSSTGSLYYFFVPHDPGLTAEKELRIVCFDDASTVTLQGMNADSSSWTSISSSTLNAGQHLDFVGNTSAMFRALELYKLEVAPSDHRCTVYEANWMETGTYGTSDDASAVSGSNGLNIGTDFVAYIGPPGLQDKIVQTPAGERTNVTSPASGYASHLYVHGTENGTSFTVSDIDTDGKVIKSSYTLERDAYFDFVIDKSTYDSMNKSSRRPYVRITATKPISVMSGNYNDNWHAFYYSPQTPEPVSSMTVSETQPSCGSTVDVTISCSNGTGPALASTQLLVNLPSGLKYVAGSASSTPSASTASKLTFALGSLAKGSKSTLTLQLQADCASAACDAAVAPEVTAECVGTGSPLSYANIATTMFTFPKSDATRMLAFAVKDQAGSAPHVDVSYSLIGGSAGSTVKLLRSLDPEPGAAADTLASTATGLLATKRDYLVQDPYATGYAKTQYYRLQVSDGTCTTTYGPVAVLTSSGGSGGGASGLESNGRLASALARRAIAGANVSSWMPEDLERAWLGRASQAETSAEVSKLAQMLPEAGPSESAPMNVSPSDLPAVTNAGAVFAADYVNSAGKRTASALLVETTGEVYEHSKALCDRANGSELDAIDASTLERGQLLRMALRNARDATGEHAVEFKLYERPDGSFALHSHWLKDQYPAPEADQRVINVQVWSAGAGDDLSLAQLLLDRLRVDFQTSDAAPSAYLARIATLGGRVQGAIAAQAEKLSLRATVTNEQNVTETRTIALDDSRRIDAHWAPFLDATLELVSADHKVLDRVWTSDGAWSAFDDGMWGGDTKLDSLQVGPCELRSGPSSSDALQLSGCASATATVSEFAGVARHLGGALAPLDLHKFGALRFRLTSSSDVRVCLGQTGNAAAGCATVSQQSGSLVTLPLSAFVDLETCDSVSLEHVNLVSFAAHAPGRQSVGVSQLELVSSAAAGSSTVRLDCQNPDLASQARHGCDVGPAAQSTRSLPLVGGILLVLVLAARRRRG